MRILLLGSHTGRLVDHLSGCDLTFVDHRLEPEDMRSSRPDWLVSFGYRYILSEDLIDEVNGRAINLHISLLPWNRGADPNFWSWIEDSPKGVTIHWMNPGLDKGAVICQREVELDPRESLRDSYDSLTNEITELFSETVPLLKSGDVPVTPQISGGTYHRSSEREEHWPAFPLGWDTPCRVVREYGERHQLRVAR